MKFEIQKSSQQQFENALAKWKGKSKKKHFDNIYSKKDSDEFKTSPNIKEAKEKN